jgi:hypothetical protein
MNHETTINPKDQELTVIVQIFGKSNNKTKVIPRTKYPRTSRAEISLHFARIGVPAGEAPSH